MSSCAGARLLHIAALAMVAMCAGAYGQTMEPLSYTNAPIGLNFLIAGYGHLWGDVLLDPSLPIHDANARINTVTVAYDRVIDVWGQSGSVAIVVPYAWLSASGEVTGEERSVTRQGIADLMLRFTANLYGAPAVSLQQFRGYKQDTIVGMSLYIIAPTGQYDDSKLINISTHRWSFKPEVGMSKALGAWTLEASAGATFFTTNNDFLGGNSRKQNPLYSIQGHAIYNVNPTLWIAADATYYTGGDTSVNGVRDNDRQSNSRWGATLAKTIDARDSVKLYFSSGATARSGSNFNHVGVAWQRRWGAGL